MHIKIYPMNLNKHHKIMVYVLRELEADKEYMPFTLDKLAEYCGMNRNGISKNMRELQEMGYVSIKVGEGKESNQYKLTI